MNVSVILITLHCIVDGTGRTCMWTPDPDRPDYPFQICHILYILIKYRCDQNKRFPVVYLTCFVLIQINLTQIATPYFIVCHEICNGILPHVTTRP